MLKFWKQMKQVKEPEQVNEPEEVKVEPGIRFTDEKRNRELTVVQKTEAGENLWFCKSQFKDAKTLYAYDEEFILENLV